MIRCSSLEHIHELVTENIKTLSYSKCTLSTGSAAQLTSIKESKNRITELHAEIIVRLKMKLSAAYEVAPMPFNVQIC